MAAASKANRPDRSKEEIRQFFVWQTEYRRRLFEHPEIKRNWSAFALGFYLSEHFDWGDQSCFHGRDLIAQALNVTPRTVTTLTKLLEKEAFIRIKRRGRYTSSIYVGMLPPEVKSISHQEVKSASHQKPDETSMKGNSASPDGKSSATLMGSELPPNIRFEHNPEHDGGGNSRPPIDTDRNLDIGDARVDARPLSAGEEEKRGLPSEADDTTTQRGYVRSDEFVPFDDKDDGGATDAAIQTLLMECLTRLRDFGGADQQRLLTFDQRSRSSDFFSLQDLRTLDAIHRRLPTIASEDADQSEMDPFVNPRKARTG